MVDSPYTPAPAEPVATPRPLLGYGLVWATVGLWALNGTISKVVLQSAELSAYRLAEVRSTGAALLLVAFVSVWQPRALRVTPRELAFLAVFGIAGLALVQLFYFLAIERLEIGIALVIQYLTPVFVALWARFVSGEPVRRRIWLAIALALSGLSLVVGIWRGMTLDGLGVAFALAGALTFTAYVLMGERALQRGRDSISLVAWGFLFAALFWAATQPWWSFPVAQVTGEASLDGRLAHVEAPVALLLAYVVVLGTLVPFAMLIGAIPHIRATRVTILATLEPVFAALVAYAWLGEELTRLQIAGAVLVLSGVALAQTARAAAPST